MQQEQAEQVTFGAGLCAYDELTHAHQRKVVLSGFPYDEGTRRNGGRIGGSVGPKVFREALGRVELYPKHPVLLVDSGNIQEDLQLEDAHEELEKKHRAILSEGHETLLVSIGGSNDQSYPNVSSLLSAYPKQPIAVINLDAHFDVRPLKEGRAHSGSPFRLMLEDPRFSETGSNFVEFGCKGAACSNMHYEYLKSKGAEAVWLQRDIRRHVLLPTHPCRTQAGQVFAGLLDLLSEKAEVIFVSFDVDVISSKWMPGVSAPSVVGGLSSEEAAEIVGIAGRNTKVRLVDFSEFNPAAESVLSGQLLAELVYWLTEGFAQRVRPHQ